MEKQVDVTANQPPPPSPPPPPSRQTSRSPPPPCLFCVLFLLFFFFLCAALNSWEGLSLSLLFSFTIAAAGAKSIIRASKCHIPPPRPPSSHTPPQPPSASRGASDLQSIIHDPTSSNHYCEERDPVVPNSPPAGKRPRAGKTGL